MRPFGAHNLLQKLAITGCELRRSEAHLKEAKTNAMRQLREYVASI